MSRDAADVRRGGWVASDAIRIFFVEGPKVTLVDSIPYVS
jgi:hypothetical protein